jgi:hypothetical protein
MHIFEDYRFHDFFLDINSGPRTFHEEKYFFLYIKDEAISMDKKGFWTLKLSKKYKTDEPFV